MIKFYFEVCPTFVEFISKHMTSGASTTLEGRRFQLSAIRTEKNHFLTLKFACCTSSFKLCPLVKSFFLKENL